jgi:hypothetical protein
MLAESAALGQSLNFSQASGDLRSRARVTARHYAAWIVEDGWRNPLQLGPGKLPPDLLVTGPSPSVNKEPKSKR